MQFITAFAVNHDYLIYALLIILACIEGPILSMIMGLLLRVANFHLLPVYIALMVGDLLGDTLWYMVGRHLGYPFVRRFGYYFSINESDIAKVEKIFHKYTASILIISKLTMGFGFAIVTLFTAGLTKIPFKKYISLNLAGQFIWTGLLLFVGYEFGDLYLTFNNALAHMTIIGLFIIIFLALIGYGKYIKKRISQTL